MFGTLNDSTILRLRVKGSDLDPLALRGRLENLLSEVSMQPRLPPSATLFIRKLSDPLPGAVQLDSSHAHAPQAWRHAFQTKFDQLVSSAARPAHGLVADSAESVVFYDYAELLASLTADWCSGFAMTRWWWKALMKRGDVAQMIRQFWREQIEYVPAALEFLVRKGVVVEFVSRLSDGEVQEIFEGVVRVFGLHALQKIQVTQITQIKGADLRPEVGAVQQKLHVGSEMPWRHVVPETDTPRLRSVQQLFVGVALMVHRAPSRVRTLSFAREVERWAREPIVELSDAPEIIVEPITERTAPPESSETLALISVNPIQAPPVELTTDPPRQRSASSAVKIANAVFTYEEPAVAIEPTVTPISEPPPATESEPIVEPPAPEAFLSQSVPIEAFTIETELGGLFYLINLAIFLEIYSDFMSPVEKFHDDLSIWDFVMIVGSEINGGRDLDDPIWTGLQDLQDVQNHENPVNLENPVNKPTWLTDLLPHIKARLVLALGLDTEDSLAQILLHHYAKVTITPTHLDVFFSLTDHPIELRLSGLDRNPGWVPAAGRFIAFHYD